jgi:2-phosphosulfolactate phosphatase
MTPGRPVTVLPRAEELGSIPLGDRAVAVVDVLRATTVIPTALAAGAPRILPAATLDEARKLHAALPPGRALLCGERDGKRVDGFDLGNSPLEYTPARVAGRVLVHASTNGSRALAAAAGARLAVAASLVNAGAVARRLLASGADPVLVACGNGGRPAIEDLAGCGLLVARLLELSPELSLDDVAARARETWRGWEPAVRESLARAPHAAYIASLGFEEDLAVCAGVDSLDLVPVLGPDGLVAERG